MRFRQFLNELLFMSKAQRNGSFVFSAMILVVLVMRLLVPYIVNDDDYSNKITLKIELLKEAEQIADSIKLAKADSIDSRKFVKTSRFQFNPNTVSYDDLLNLGFDKKTANIFINYRKSGAKFYNAEDLLNVYGIDTALFSTLKEYVVIPEQLDTDNSNTTQKTKNEHVKSSKTNKTKDVSKKHIAIGEIDINTADTTSLKLLPGIGSVFASRICNFRNYLGGFHRIEQLKEVYNLPAETYQSIQSYLTIDTSVVDQININFCSVGDLKKHPYCSYQNARDIIDHRARNGNYRDVSDLTKDSVLSLAAYNKIKPYLTVKVEHLKAVK
ncbi:MAG: helix-hairpin-helix domain-containing protein [Prolixibacteraceae bacterium]|nr:helix-hairpin-helix domain-containing protein [Prolixibacteraceae bacterium]